MKHITLSLIFAIFAALPVLAQENAEGGDGEVGEVYVRETHGDWNMRCVRTPEDQADVCHLHQRLFSDPDNALAEALFYAFPAGNDPAAIVEFIAPLRTLLTAGIGISIDGGPVRRAPFTFCDRGGCIARISLTALELQAFRAGGSAQIVLVPAQAQNQPAAANMSLAGFTAGMGGLILSQQAPE